MNNAATSTSRMVTAPVLKQRFHWMDMLRGAAIVLILIWHASAIPVIYGFTMPAAVRAANMFFLPFRMPTLMFLSGLLLPASLRKPLLAYYSGKFAMIAWPYVVFVTLDRFVSGTNVPWWHWRAYYATSYLWFLFFIGVYYAVAPLLRRLPWWLPVAVALIASAVLPAGIEERLAYFAVFFFLGQAAATHPRVLRKCTSGRLVWAWVGVAASFGALSSIFGLRLAYLVQYAPLSLAGVLTAISLARGIEQRGLLLPKLTSIGRNSIVYYAAHFPVMVGLTVGMRSIGLNNLLLVTTANLVIATAFCALLAHLRRYIPVRWLFAAPALMTSWTKKLSPVGVAQKRDRLEVQQHPS